MSFNNIAVAPFLITFSYVCRNGVITQKNKSSEIKNEKLLIHPDWHGKQLKERKATHCMSWWKRGRMR